MPDKEETIRRRVSDLKKMLDSSTQMLGSPLGLLADQVVAGDPAVALDRALTHIAKIEETTGVRYTENDSPKLFERVLDVLEKGTINAEEKSHGI